MCQNCNMKNIKYLTHVEKALEDGWKFQRRQNHQAINLSNIDRLPDDQFLRRMTHKQHTMSKIHYIYQYKLARSPNNPLRAYQKQRQTKMTICTQPTQQVAMMPPTAREHANLMPSNIQLVMLINLIMQPMVQQITPMGDQANNQSNSIFYIVTQNNNVIKLPNGKNVRK